MAVTEITAPGIVRELTGTRTSAVVDAGPLRTEDMVSLYRSLIIALPDRACRLVQVIAANRGEGTSTVARGLAAAAASVGNAKVLLCDATSEHDEFTHFGMKFAGASLNDVCTGRSDLRLAVEPVPSRSFSICALADPGAGARVAVNVDSVFPVLDRLREQYDLIVIDSPAVNRGILGPALTKKADGVVFVVEAERTRAPVVAEAQRVIEINGGRLLGTILNKRRFHVPKMIYRWL